MLLVVSSISNPSWARRSFQILVSIVLKGSLIPLLSRDSTPHFPFHCYQTTGSEHICIAAALQVPQWKWGISSHSHPQLVLRMGKWQEPGTHSNPLVQGNFYVVYWWGWGQRSFPGWFFISLLQNLLLMVQTLMFKLSKSKRNIFSHSYQLRTFSMNLTSSFWSSQLCNESPFLCSFWLL